MAPQTGVTDADEGVWRLKPELRGYVYPVMKAFVPWVLGLLLLPALSCGGYGCNDENGCVKLALLTTRRDRRFFFRVLLGMSDRAYLDGRRGIVVRAYLDGR